MTEHPTLDEVKKQLLFEHGIGQIETKEHGTVSGKDYMEMVKFATLIEKAKKNDLGVEVIIKHKDEGLLKSVLTRWTTPPNDENIKYQNDLQYEFETHVNFKYFDSLF